MEKMIKLKAALVEKIWGGSQLKRKYGKISNQEKIGESWEVSCHKNGMSTVASGAHAGQTFGDWLTQYPKDKALGTKCQDTSAFPLLIKFIDASQALSIQVHPDDAYAQKVEHSLGKTEMWIVLECEPGAFLYYGVNQSLSPEDFQTHIKNNTIESVLNRVPVKKGDVFYIEAGTIHAIGAGIVICEIQENSDTTYRVYDFDRTDDRGNRRELHIPKAAEVSTLTPPTKAPGPAESPVLIPGGSSQLLAACSYFRVKSYISTSAITIPLNTDSFLALNCLDGCGQALLGDEQLSFEKGDSLFIPAQAGLLSIEGICNLAATTL